MKRTPLQRHNRAMNLADKKYCEWQAAQEQINLRAARRTYCQYIRLLSYLDALEDAYPVFKDDCLLLFHTF